MNNARLICGILIILMGLIIIVGSALPWATVQSVLGSINKSGMDGDGKLTIAAGGIAILGGILLVLNEGPLAGIIITGLASGAALTISIIDLNNVLSKTSSLTSQYVMGSVGTGIYIVLVGGVLSLLCAFIACFVPQPEPKLFVCPQCGERIRATAKFCGECGYQMMAEKKR